MSVAFCIEASKAVITPCSEGRPFIIDKNTPIFYRGLLGDEIILPGQYNLGASCGHYMGPVY